MSVLKIIAEYRSRTGKPSTNFIWLYVKMKNMKSEMFVIQNESYSYEIWNE